MRNSSLVESGGADNVAGIKSTTDAMDMRVVWWLQDHDQGAYGRGASPPAEKPERKHRWSGGECGCRYE